MLWSVRLKGLGPVMEKLIEASPGREWNVAEAYGALIGHRVIGVEKAVVADESILEPVKEPVKVGPIPASRA